MVYNFNDFKNKIQEVENWLISEFSLVRTGRATPLILDKVMVESYGSFMPVKNVANIASEDARTLKVTPWDTSIVSAVEKAIISADLGLSVNSDGKSLRVIFPELTGERRTQLIKLSKQKLEDARVSLRMHRENVWSDIQKKEKDGLMNEDEKFRSKEEMQKFVDEANKKFEEHLAKKEEEIQN